MEGQALAVWRNLGFSMPKWLRNMDVVQVRIQGARESSEEAVMEEKSEFSKSYSDKGFWDKVGSFAGKIGKELLVQLLVAYAAMSDKETPAGPKAVLLGALGYFILPIDAIPDLAPLIGYTDDAAVLAAALASVGSSINDTHKSWASEKAREWLG
jgi:uncharacterized membrane protein YkvA (DUF1232 family)